MSKRILVAVASKHGATKEIGSWVSEALRSRGFDVVELAPEQVQSLEGYDAVVIGSAVYMTKWLDSARDFAAKFNQKLRELPLWAFSVGLSGVPRDSVQDPSRVGPVLLTIEPVSYKTFPGSLDPDKLNWRERTVARLGGAVEGDYRDRAAVEEWVSGIADTLSK